MFQLGKLVVQSTVSTLGTASIAANAIILVMEFLGSMPSMAIGIGLMTVAGQCIGAGRLDEAKYNIKKLTLWSTIVLFGMNWLIFALARPVCALASLDQEATEITIRVMLIIAIVKPVLWPLGFIPGYGMRAAGDVRFGWGQHALHVVLPRRPDDAALPCPRRRADRYLVRVFPGLDGAQHRVQSPLCPREMGGEAGDRARVTAARRRIHKRSAGKPRRSCQEFMEFKYIRIFLNKY
jgi:hypothetical protein